MMHNKKIFKIILFLLCILLLEIISFIHKNNVIPTLSDKETTGVSIEPTDQVYYQLFVTLLHPYVEEAIHTYYDEYMTLLPSEAPYSYIFTKIESATPGYSYSYRVEIEVQPYVGPHLSVGRDKITLKIDLEGVTIEKFEHLESYELPSNYQDIIKKNLP